MSARTRVGWWAVGLLVGLQGVGLSVTAGAQERLRGGMLDLTLAGAVSVSHNNSPARDLETVTGLHLIPHLGYVVTDEHGPRLLRGNFELLAEPTLIHLDAQKSATVGGLAALGRWLFAASPSIHPYLEAGVGILGGKSELRQTTCDVNYILEAGPGVVWFVSETTAVTVGYRFHHMSNGGKCSKNLGLNSSMFVVGVSYFFP